MRIALLSALVACFVAGAAQAQPQPDAAPGTLAGGDPASKEPDERRQVPEPPRDGASDDKPAIGTLPVGPAAPPPSRYQSWGIEGDLQDPEATVLAFLERTMRDNLLDANKRKAIAARLSLLGYHLLGIERRKLGRGYQAVLRIEPITLVRRVSITVHNEGLILGDISDDDVRRRIQLRAGSRLPRAEADIKSVLLREEKRIADYLRTEGFFEARVTVRRRHLDTRRKLNPIWCSAFPVPCQIPRPPRRRYQVELDVDVVKGPPYHVGKLRVVGNADIESKRIISKFHHRRGCVGPKSAQVCLPGKERFSRRRLTEDLEAVTKLYQARGFPGVRVRTDFSLLHSFKRNTKTVEFTVYISERRHISVTFIGNDKKRFPDTELEKVLTFSTEGSYDDIEVATSTEALRNHYQRRGYFEAVVTAERVPLVEDLERIVFYISEGPQLPARSVEFSGNRSIPRERLASAVSTSVGRSILGGTKGFVTSSGLRGDVDKIIEIYKKEGFASARVDPWVARDSSITNAAALAATVAAESRASGLFVVFRIDEGRRSRIQGVRFAFKGEHRFQSRDLSKVIQTRVGQPWRPDLAKAEVARLNRYYFAKGYPNAEVKAASERQPNGDYVTVFEIEEKQPVRLGKVAIRGNFKTADWVIRGELGYHEGAPMTLDRVDTGQQNLRATGLFSSVNVDLIDFGERNSTDVNVLVTVQEQYDRLADLEAGLGYSSDQGAFVDGGWKAPNMFGWGIGWEARGQYGTVFSNLENKFTFPQWIWRKLLRLSFRLENVSFYRNEETPRFGDLESFGTSFAASKQGRRGFLEGWVFLFRYDFRQRNREVDLVRPAGASEDLEKAPVTTRTGAIGPQIIIDKRTDSSGRRNPLVPTKGFRLETRALYADSILFGDDRFIKVGVSAQHFLSLSERILVFNGIRYDHGFPLGGEVLLPDVERFFAGGDTTARGFERDRLATELVTEGFPPFGDITQLRVIPAGGNIRFIHNFDVQLRLWKLWGFPVASAIFLDTALVTNSLDGFEVSDLRHSIGMAVFRWVSPIGSVSVEYAMPLDPQLGDNPRGRLHLNMGLLF